MKQLVLIIPSLSAKLDIKRIVKQIISYVGTRMVEQADAEMPGVVLKETLSEEDKKTLKEMCLNDNRTGALAFITFEENFDGEWIDAIMIQDEDED